MAEVTVNHDSKVYTVNNGVNKKAFKFDNLGGGSQRSFHLTEYSHNINEATYQAKFMELDTDDVNGYEGDDSGGLGNIGVEGNVDPSWITSGKLDLKLLKTDAINKLFNKKYKIEPLNANGTVKVEFV